jgi:flagellar assembly protein FliH
MRSPAKFLFDTDFTAAEGRPAAAMLAEQAAKVADAEATGYRAGLAAARAEAEQRTFLALERIAAALQSLSGDLSALEVRLENEAVEVAIAAAGKLAPELIAREPFAEMSALMSECFRHLVAAPHVAVRVSESELAAAREHLDAAMQASGFGGRLVVLAEPDIASGDCRIEWADGGIKRERATTQAAIDEAVQRYLAGRRGEIYLPEVSWRSER